MFYIIIILLLIIAFLLWAINKAAKALTKFGKDLLDILFN